MPDQTPPGAQTPEDAALDAATRARLERLARDCACADGALLVLLEDESTWPDDPALAALVDRAEREGRACEAEPAAVPFPGRPGAALAIPAPGAAPPARAFLTAWRERPGTWSVGERAALHDVAALAGTLLRAGEEAGARRERDAVAVMLGRAVENMQLGVTVTDAAGRILYTNPAEARMHGYAVEELVGEHARLLGPPRPCREADAPVPAGTSWSRESVNVRKDGSRFPVLLWSDVVRDAGGRTLGTVTCCEDITERKKAERHLKETVLRDPLTGLPNRTHFLERLTRALQHSQEEPDFQFAVLFLDLDRFKVVNDSLGHHAGDELLRVIAERLLSAVRPTDTVARFGGDEFAVLLDGVGGVDDASGTAARIQRSIAAPIQLDGYELFTSASIGIVMSGPGFDRPEHFWRSADMAMYRAKARGANLCAVFDRAMHAEALSRLQLETDLRHALGRQEFRLVYQPILSLASNRVVGLEALVRWDHPLRGLVTPAEFIPLAEETGMIQAIGEWVLEEACRQTRAWQDAFPRPEPLWVGINLSRKQISQPDLLERVRAVLQRFDIPARTVKLEITESAVMEHSAAAVATLAGLKELGVQLLMDDFGTGYSSLSYLHLLPLDAIKIDRSFVSQMSRGDKHAQLVETIIQLARGAGLQVVAEGVTTREQHEFLRELGCELAQGFLFAMPLDAPAVGSLLAGDAMIG